MQKIIITSMLGLIIIIFTLTLFIKRKNLSKTPLKNLVRILVCSVLLICIYNLPSAWFVSTGGKIGLILSYIICYVIIGYDVLLKALKGVKKLKLLDECFLMTVATVGAFILGAVFSGDYFEGVAVMLFYQIGEWFSNYAYAKSVKNVTSLINIRPDYANLEGDGKLIKVKPSAVKIGEIITVLAGEKIPIDGVIVSGESTLNVSALTGESLPKEVKKGDLVNSGSININGLLRIKTTKSFENSSASKILSLTISASRNKARQEKFITRFAKWYTPAVCICSAVLAVIPPIIRVCFGVSANWQNWLYRGLTFLVVSCPCALVISVPLAFFTALGGASKMGVLIKGANVIEGLSKIKTVAFDKTGTLTTGEFEVTAVLPANGFSKESLIYYSALAERNSNHPVAKSIVKEYGNINNAGQIQFTELIGMGVRANIEDKEILVGNERLLSRYNISYKKLVGVGVLVAINGIYAGQILVRDKIKTTSCQAINSLNKLGVKTIMLSGDNHQQAKQVSKELNITEYHARLLPKDKLDKLEELIINKPKNSTVAFVGDGINDAPVISRADVSFAMGLNGQDATMESADILVMDDNPQKIAGAIKQGKKTIRVVYQNVIFSLIVKLACLVLGSLNIGGMYLAIFADVGVMCLAVLNSLRCFLIKK